MFLKLLKVTNGNLNNFTITFNFQHRINKSNESWLLLIFDNNIRVCIKVLHLFGICLTPKNSKIADNLHV